MESNDVAGTPKKRIDRLSVAVALVLLGTLLTFSIASPVSTTNGLVAARVGSVKVLGFWFILIVILCMVFNGFLAFSKYGTIRMGKEKPQYKTFSWVAMIFCAAMGTSILYWSAIEWAYYIQWPPFGLEALGPEISELSVAYSFFHWGVPAWSVYAVGVIPLAYRYYMRKKDDLSLQVACEGAFGKRVFGPLGKVINVIFIFGILGGLVISYGTGIPMLANNLKNIVGTPETFVVYALFVLLITATFASSTYIGLEKGMQKISRGTTYGSILLCALFLILVSPLFIMENFVQSLGLMIQEFIPMSTYLDPIRKSNFPQDWTCFYWAWWIGLAPWMWIFIAKISRGRSIRAIVAIVTLAGSAGSFLFFGTISSYGLGAYLREAFDVVAIMAEQGANQAISEMVLSLPAGIAILVIWLVVGFFLLVTTMDSAAYTLAAASTVGLRATDDPSKNLRLFWSIMLAISPTALLYAGQYIEGGVPLGGLQATLILTAIPISFLIVAVMYSGIKWLKEDYGHRTKEEIAQEFLSDEVRERLAQRREQGGEATSA
ncbi:MAG: BCCT family transporter [Clostridiales Family XIII bacterium]|jgi:BCCT family betaine/carnitine transporter|nr:BCCT family transporter [Clostridiales Family XIII bacterium]